MRNLNNLGLLSAMRMSNHEWEALCLCVSLGGIAFLFVHSTTKFIYLRHGFTLPLVSLALLSVYRVCHLFAANNQLLFLGFYFYTIMFRLFHISIKYHMPQTELSAPLSNVILGACNAIQYAPTYVYQVRLHA